ncbi:MAG TPA: RICIN domain-containing protein, partial [Mycobacterium sp.]|nr:RICIN domain-containing protein [Mycobacterium sp.]
KCMTPKTDPNGNWATGGGYPTASSSTWPPPPHTLVAVYDCNGTPVQKWTVNADGTIRPENAGNLCLDRWNGSTVAGTAIQLYTCSGTTAQQWTRP